MVEENKSLLDTILGTAKESLAERLSSPLLSSFAIAWCLWNYKFLVILFSENSVSTTFSLIDRVAFPTGLSIFIQGVVLPLLSALAYVFIYPYPARFVFAFTLRMQRATNETRQRIEEETLLSVEESRAIRDEMREIARRYEAEKDQLNAEIAKQAKEINRLLEGDEKGQATDPDTANSALSPRYQHFDELQQLLLQTIETYDPPVSESGLLGTLNKYPREAVKLALGELTLKKLLTRKYDYQKSGFAYDFTHNGRRVLAALRDPGSNSVSELDENSPKSSEPLDP